MLGKIIKKLAYPIIEMGAYISKRVAYFFHWLLFKIIYIADVPDNFNHDIDLYYQWERYSNSHWIERGVFNKLAIQMFTKPYCIELCCGEAFYTKFFYAVDCEKIYACDYDKQAIKRSQKKYSGDNIIYEYRNILNGIPQKIEGNNPTNIIFDAAIEYFNEEDMNFLMDNIYQVLKPCKGILSGSVPKSTQVLTKNTYRNFNSKEAVFDYLKRWFKNIVVFETICKERTNFYFYASDGDVPMEEQWKHCVKEVN